MKTNTYVLSMLLIFQNGKKHKIKLCGLKLAKTVEQFRTEVKGRYADRKNKLSNVFLTYTER